MTVGPQISVLHERNTTRLDAAYELSGLIYFNNSDLNTINHSANAALNTDLTQKTKFSLSDRLGYTKDSHDTTLTGIQINRAEIVTNSVAMGILHTITQRAAVGFNIEDRLLILHGANASNSRTDSASLNGSFQLTDSTSLSSSYTFTNFRYEADNVVNTLTSHSVQAGANQVLMPSLTFGISAGAVYTPSISEHYDWILATNLSKTFERTSFNIGYTKSLLNASGLSNQLNISERYLFNMNHSFTNSLSLSVFGNYSLNHTKPVTTVNIRSYEAGVSTQWLIYDWLTAELGYSHFEQKSHGSVGSDILRDHAFISFNIVTFIKKYD